MLAEPASPQPVGPPGPPPPGTPCCLGRHNPAPAATCLRQVQQVVPAGLHELLPVLGVAQGPHHGRKAAGARGRGRCTASWLLQLQLLPAARPSLLRGQHLSLQLLPLLLVQLLQEAAEQVLRVCAVDGCVAQLPYRGGQQLCVVAGIAQGLHKRGGGGGEPGGGG